MDALFEFVGKVVAVGGSAALIAHGVFLAVGKKWLENHFAERLEAYKHEQAKELEELRFRINAQFNRITKIHDKEIEVLPEAWRRLLKATAQLQFFIAPGRQYPALDRMTPQQFEEYLAGTNFMDWEKEELRSSDQKLQKYLRLHNIIYIYI